MAFLIDYLPPKLHFVLASRGEPPLPLARYRARGEMQELGVAEFRFRLEEARALLNESMGLALTPTEIEVLEEQLEGWVAGLQMAAIALKRGLATTDQLAVEGQQRFIANYLREAWHFQYPIIGLAQAWFLGMTGSVAACLDHVYSA